MEINWFSLYIYSRTFLTSIPYLPNLYYGVFCDALIKLQICHVYIGPRITKIVTDNTTVHSSQLLILLGDEVMNYFSTASS
jgi:hypothetical protein